MYSTLYCDVLTDVLRCTTMIRIEQSIQDLGMMNVLSPALLEIPIILLMQLHAN